MVRTFVGMDLRSGIVGAALFAGACGSVAGTEVDAAAPDAGDAEARDGAGGTFGGSDAGSDVAWATDSACGDGGLDGDAGATFACGTATCAAESEYCGRFAAGLRPFLEPQRGCQPLPCGCVPERSCACLGVLPDYCQCSTVAGAITVTCSLP